MYMNHLTGRSDSLFPSWKEVIFPISSLGLELGETSMLKPRGSGRTTIDINISLSSNSTQSLTSDSFSKELPTESVKDLQLLIETFVKDVEEVYSKELPGPTVTTEESQESGTRNSDENN
jgi:hypothetical protein